MVALLVVTFAFPVPSTYTDAPWWVTLGSQIAYATLALAIGGTYWITTRIVRASIRWAIENAPSQADGQHLAVLL